MTSYSGGAAVGKKEGSAKGPSVQAQLYQIHALKHFYNGQMVLDIDALEIEAGAIVGLSGPNGSGKSTLLRLLGFIQKPQQGSIVFQGERAAPFAPEVRFSVTILPQDAYLMKRTVYQNIAYGLRLRGLGRKNELDQAVHAALTQVGLLPPAAFAQREWSALSGGEAQRTALAARLALKPKVLLLDEPTANVDIQSSQLIKTAALNARKQHGATLIVASHDREWLDEVCDHVICLFKGRITGRDRDNIIFGPWQECSGQSCVRSLSDNQLLVMPRPPVSPSAACIDPDLIKVKPTGSISACRTPLLRCTILRLTLAKGDGRIILTLKAGELILVARTHLVQIENQRLYPGKPVCLEIPESAVRWIEL